MGVGPNALWILAGTNSKYGPRVANIVVMYSQGWYLVCLHGDFLGPQVNVLTW